jgi:RNA polymerase subunit RPABC4/transcription elongation factor Spt4
MSISENNPAPQPSSPATAGGAVPPKNDLLTNCAACAHRVSKAAHSCPSCGHILNEKKVSTSGFTWFGIIVIILSAFGLLNSPSSESYVSFVFLSGIVSGMMFIGLGGIITLLRRL